MTFSFQPGAERAVVFDDAVVDERDVPGLVEVRVGIHLGWRAVSGPAGVRDAGGGSLEQSGGQVGAGFFAEFCDFSRGFCDHDAILVDHRETGGIIAAVFQAAESIDEHAGGVRFS